MANLKRFVVGSDENFPNSVDFDWGSDQLLCYLKCHRSGLDFPRIGQNQTLYNFRHTFATFALLNDGIDIHTLAIQMGTSIAVIGRHCSLLTPRLRKKMLTCKRYELSREEFEELAETLWKKGLQKFAAADLKASYADKETICCVCISSVVWGFIPTKSEKLGLLYTWEMKLHQRWKPAF